MDANCVDGNGVVSVNFGVTPFFQQVRMLAPSVTIRGTKSSG